MTPYHPQPPSKDPMSHAASNFKHYTTHRIGEHTVNIAFTDRSHGNLGLHVTDSAGEPLPAQQTLENRARLQTLMGAPAFYLEQVHGTAIARAEEHAPAAYSALNFDGTLAKPASVREAAPIADASISSEGALAIMVADCIPVVFAASQRSAGGVRPLIATAHAGRKGLLDGVLQKTVRALREAGGEDIHAWIGPSICGSCYEVPELMREESVALIPEVYSETVQGTSGLDLPAGARALLEHADVTVHSEYNLCTLEHENLYSHRAFGAQGREPGRIAGLVWI